MPAGCSVVLSWVYSVVNSETAGAPSRHKKNKKINKKNEEISGAAAAAATGAAGAAAAAAGRNRPAPPALQQRQLVR